MLTKRAKWRIFVYGLLIAILVLTTIAIETHMKCIRNEANRQEKTIQSIMKLAGD